MATLTAPACYAGEFLLYEEEVTLSREAVTLVAGVALPAGQVLGQVTASGNYAAYDNAATDGTQTAAGILLAPAAASLSVRPATAIVRLAVVSEAKLTGLDSAGKADLAAAHVICR